MGIPNNKMRSKKNSHKILSYIQFDTNYFNNLENLVEKNF